MKRMILGLLSALLMLAGLSSTFAQDPTTFTIDVRTPEIERGDFGEWDSRFTDPGAVIYHDGQFHMFRNGFTGWPAPVEVAYHTSEDGLTWTEISEEPIIYTDDWPIEVGAALAHSGFVLEDGTWVLYFSLFGSAPEGMEFSIMRATAPEPLGPWELTDTPVLTPGSSGEWDDLRIWTPSVLQTPEGYIMFYTGISADSPIAGQSIGMATSEDGIEWEKYDDPATTDAPYAESDPVFTPTGNDTDFDGVNVQDPQVIEVEDQYYMMYRSFVRGPRNITFSFATSPDGITWERIGQPVLTDQDTLRNRPIWFSELVHVDDTLYGYFELQDNFGGTNIHPATLPLNAIIEAE